jgi:hypothetical protein
MPSPSSIGEKMENFKNLFKSAGVWTAIFGLVVAVLIALGILPEGFDSQGAYAIILALVSALGGYFRFRATDQLTVGNPAAAKARSRNHY